jgi:hypothetical protein
MSTIPILPEKSAVCPACRDRRIHTDAEWLLYHPLAGTGSQSE